MSVSNLKLNLPPPRSEGDIRLLAVGWITTGLKYKVGDGQLSARGRLVCADGSAFSHQSIQQDPTTVGKGVTEALGGKAVSVCG